MNLYDGGHEKPSIDVRKQLRATFEVLFQNLATQQSGIDFQQHDVLASTKDPVESCPDLMRIRAVDESLAFERGRCVFTGLRTFECFFL